MVKRIYKKKKALQCRNVPAVVPWQIEYDISIQDPRFDQNFTTL